MKFLKKALIGTLAVAATLGLTACNDKRKDVEIEWDENDADTPYYQKALGEFYQLYANAKAELTDMNKRYVMMAQAEAKMLESGVFTPLTSQGGAYSVSNIAPHTVPYVLFGNDNDRLKTSIVATKAITKVDRDAMKKEWSEKRLTKGFDYPTYVKEYLAAHGYDVTKTLNMGYASDPTQWDVLATSKAADSEVLVNLYDGLLEYDSEGELTPALAESYTVSEDGLTYTFKIRQNQSWVDFNGTKIAAITANDFVAGFQHMLDAKGGLEWLVDGVVAGVTEYLEGTGDMSGVGIKAEDASTLTFTLTQVTPYFTTMLGYGLFAPLCKTYYESKGGKFGDDFDKTAETYLYGKGFDSIAYCGPYTVKEATSKSAIRFTKNPSYWNPTSVNCDAINWFFYSGEDVTATYKDWKLGKIAGAGLNNDTIALCKADNLFDSLVYTSDPNATTYCAFYNIRRQTYALSTGGVVSKQTDAQKTATSAALNNQHFRLALNYAFDRGAYNKQARGEDLKYTNLCNSYTPATFCALTSDVKFEGHTFKTGTNYGQCLQYFLEKDGSPIKVVNEKGESNGFDGWFNEKEAVKELNLAIKELAAEGVTVNAEFPINIDLPYYAASKTNTNKANSYKKSLEEVLGGRVVVNLIEASLDDWYLCGYDTTSGKEANYDMYDLSGWGPDYGDPSSYLDTMLPNGAGYMSKCLGLW